MRNKLIRVTRFCCVLLLANCGLNAASGRADAQRNTVPVPVMIIYPGDLITDELLADRDFSADPGAGQMAGVRMRAELVGKAARRTLLPGQPIPANAVSAPKVVSNGAKVRMLFEDGGLRITALGTALQSGSAGDTIAVRNMSSGLTVSGIVQTDGSVYIGGG